MATSDASAIRVDVRVSQGIVPIAANVFAALTRVEAREPNPSQSVPMIVAPFLNAEERGSTGEPRKTVPAWMSLLLQQIKKIRDERVSAGRAPDAPEAD